MNNTNIIKKSKPLELTLVALMAAVMVVCAWISIPTAIPFTLQTFAVFATTLILDGKKGTFTVLIYLLIGSIGIPVFAGFKGGLGVIIGPTGGYLIGFIIIPVIYWFAFKFLPKKTYLQTIVLLVGLAMCYLFGTFWFMYGYTGADEISFVATLSLCVIPFIIPDLIKLTLAILISKTLKARLSFLKDED